MEASAEPRPVIVIPAYEPDDTLLALVQELAMDPQQEMVIVDDGSSNHCVPIFEQLSNSPQVKVIRHPVNLGKGQALRTAFNHVLLHCRGDVPGVVTADADGQHRPKDILAVADHLQRDPTALILGEREFQGSVPWRSRLGNAMTRQVFLLLLGRRLHDTQTGLRGIPRSLLPCLLQIHLAGYDFELAMLIVTVREDALIRTVPIQTVYTNDNKNSHFDPVLDSLRVYLVFLRYFGLEFLVAVTDFCIFAVSFWVTGNILVSVVMAGIGAAVIDFGTRRRIRPCSGLAISPPDQREHLVRTIGQRALAYVLLVGAVDLVNLNVYLGKLLVELVLMFALAAMRPLLHRG